MLLKVFLFYLPLVLFRFFARGCGFAITEASFFDHVPGAERDTNWTSLRLYMLRFFFSSFRQEKSLPTEAKKLRKEKFVLDFLKNYSDIYLL